MQTISNILFWISNGLLVPVVILLLLFFVRAIVLAAGFFGEYYRRKTILQATKFINSACRDDIVKGIDALAEQPGSIYVDRLKDMLAHHDNAEVDAAKELSGSRILMKLGPMLGLMGTLIPMGPALVGLAAGDISSMAYNMQVAFATTVVGMLIAAVGVATLQVRQRWYARELNNLEYVKTMLCHEKE